MDVLNLKYNMGLLEKKAELERSLSFVKKEIQMQQEDCFHVEVVLGDRGYYNSDYSQCLFCGKDLCNCSDIIRASIDASTYLRGRFGDGSRLKDRQERFLELQNLWISLVEENPTATEDDLFLLMREAVEKDEVQNKELEKKLGFKL